VPTALIADDERLMREQLREALGKVWPELDIIAEARNGLEAISLSQEKQPDVAFLDIRMPGCDGLEAARSISRHAHVVFVTAYDQHAVAAFDQGAIDYLLKPTEPERLALCVQRLKDKLAASPTDMGQLLALLGTRLEARHPNYLQSIQAGVGNSIQLIPVGEILFFTSDDKYTRVCTSTTEVLIRAPIRELVTQLDPGQFWQIHRASIVRFDAILRVTRDDRGHLLLQLRGHSETLEVSRSFQHLFRQM
jgi:DNA-binding LytR/AlgR family response regulator